MYSLPFLRKSCGITLYEQQKEEACLVFVQGSPDESGVKVEDADDDASYGEEEEGKEEGGHLASPLGQQLQPQQRLHVLSAHTHLNLFSLSFYLEQLTPSQLEWVDDFSTSSLFLPRTINS